MVFYYGTKATNLRNGQIINVDCPNCNTNVSMIYSVFGKYGHLYLIPFFPIKKLTFAECNSCKKTFEQKELPAPIQQKLEGEKEKNKVKTPIWMFSGLFLIAAIIGLVSYSSHQTDLDTASFIKDPKAGDIYYLDSVEGYYTTLKINQVSKDSLTVFLNDMEIGSKTEMDKIDIDKNYTKKSNISKKDMLKLYNEKKIYEVKRN
ncbi:zinc-ribbon domain-containing protein [Flavobacterium cupreum]|uniref:Zinc-ribbon domain-containing protein n=1 Tax=Flavobacterium cupreum TaxID=2133766 RepID=A0A434ACB6_9FLAO|nr:zinc-ribbon domain-containing protein [Flavobacterium cupreum]RUT72010.1 zinc-ribbon domain-containing protein [Flavobacterium cupreum]